MLVMDMRDIFHSVKTASRKLAIVADATRNAVLETLADKIEAKGDVLLDANSRDLARPCMTGYSSIRDASWTLPAVLGKWRVFLLLLEGY